MPAVTIEVRRPYLPDEEVQIINAVHEAMKTGLKTPDWDKTIRFIEHEPYRFSGPPDKTDRYTLVPFDMFSGRSLDAKRNLYLAIVQNLSVLGIPPEEILINLREHPPENWGIQGGKPASETDIGFNIRV